VEQQEHRPGGGAAGGIEVWFVVLDRPKVGGDAVVEARLRQAGMLDEQDSLRRWRQQRKGDVSAREAYRRLAANVSQAHIPLRLRVAADRVVVAYIRHRSLSAATAASHPAAGAALPRSLLRATYTAGSMAGLGLAMAIAGVSAGLLAGFLLWKRRLGLPPYADLSSPPPFAS